MKKTSTALCRFVRFSTGVAAMFLVCAPGLIKAADRNCLPVNQYGAPVIEAKGQHINYDRKSLERMAGARGTPTPRPRPTPAPRPGAPPPPIGRPFWQYAVFGADIGGSNIIIGSTPAGGAPEIIFDSYSYNSFWQSIRYNPSTGNYDQVFVSPLYSTDPYSYVYIRGLELGKVTAASNRQIVVMLEDGRIYVYDFATKAELGHFDTSVAGGYGLTGLTLFDLDGDGLAELILTNQSDLFVFDGTGQLLWQVPGAGGYDVVAGQMDNDPAIEIAASNGVVVDASTHAAQWTYGNGFGVHLKLAPFPGENYQQLISASDWQFVYSYDVGRQLPRWSIQTPQDIGAIDVADVDNDGVPEVIIGDGQWGNVHVHDLINQTLKWEVNNPEHGVTNIAIGDVDNDGVVDVLWGAGATSSGPDYLYVANTTGAHDIKWQNLDLEGPFLGPAIGDLDGDGQPELVICSTSSEAGYSSGRILVFDLGTLALRAVSPPVADGFSAYGVHDLKLRNVEDNGRMQIVIATESGYDGLIEIYRFDSNNTFTRIWTNTTRPFSSFYFAEVADLDNNGTHKIVGGTDGYVFVYDYPSGAQSWQSVNLPGNVTGLLVEDLNLDGNKEIAALVNNGDLYTWDGPSLQLRNLRQGTDGAVLSQRATPAGLVLGDISGVGHFLQWNNDTYTETFTRQLASDCDPYAYPSCLNGINVTSDNALWTGIGSILNQRLGPSYDNVAWESPAIGGGFGRFVVTAVRGGRDCVFSSAQHAVVGLAIAQSPAPMARRIHGPHRDRIQLRRPTPESSTRVIPRNRRVR
jgi:WD40 repeat protein